MTILSIAVDLLAVIAPLTGSRASGVVTMVGPNVNIPRNTVIIPIIDGVARTSMMFKVARGPNADKSWTATALGAAINVFSNIGGARHNLPADTQFIIYPPTISGVTSIVAADNFTGGADATGWGAVKDAVIYDQADGPALHIDLTRSMVKDFPAFILCWASSDHADGGTITTERNVDRKTTIFREQYFLALVMNRSDSDMSRRAEAYYILDEAAKWLNRRCAIDGRRFSSTDDGVFVQSRNREIGRHEVYQRYSIYGITFTVEHAISRYDTREYNAWLTTVIDVTKPQVPPLPDQGDYPMVTDMIVDMEQPS